MKDQGKINQIVYKFITNYDALFKEENEISPCDEWVNSKILIRSITQVTSNTVRYDTFTLYSGISMLKKIDLQNFE